MAGDLTIFGKRENVLLVRENSDGTKSAYRINLKKSDVMSSPVYYLRQNDFVYVEPRKAKSDATDAAQQKYIAIATAILSIIILFGYKR
jgi:polysaccharide export outer membrane protein